MFRVPRDRRYETVSAFFLAATLLVGPIGCQATLVDELSEEQANQVLVALSASSIAAKKVARARPDGLVRYRVEVASDELASALTRLRAADLPARPAPGLNEVFGNPGLLPTTTEERARYAAALSGELERSIEAMDGVVDARVHIALPEICMAPLDSPRPRGRASVMIKQRQRAKPVDERAVRSLVAGATSEITPSEVAIINLVASEPATVAPELVRIGPITVLRSSALTLKIIAVSVALLDIALAVALVVLFTRSRRFTRRTEVESEHST